MLPRNAIFTCLPEVDCYLKKKGVIIWNSDFVFSLSRNLVEFWEVFYLRLEHKLDLFLLLRSLKFT